MGKTVAILVGLKQVDPNHWDGWCGENGCWGCELDVDNVARILKPEGFKSPQLLKTANATKANVLGALSAAAKTLRSSDMLVFYYSGHGGQQPDVNGDEQDGQDETLCAYDGEILDDQLNEIWPRFRRGVRIVMMSDSCNSGTNYRLIRNVSASKATPIEPVDESVEMQAQLIHIGACRDGESAPGYQQGGAFTRALCDVWNDGAFSGNYAQLVEAIRRKIPGQVVQYNEYGPLTVAFRNSRPFSTAGDAPSSVADRESAPETPLAFVREASGRLVGRRFDSGRGPGDAPAAQGAVAKSTFVLQVAQQALAGKFSSDPGIRTGDGIYYLPTLDEVRQLLAESNGDRRQWLAERFDCDDFAYVLKGEASVHAYDAGDLRYGLALGMVWGNFDWVNGYHAINWFVDNVGTLYLIEPQSDAVYPASRCLGDIGLLLV